MTLPMDAAKCQAKKNDKDKARYDLISPYAMEALAKVLAFGAKKYGERNWEDGVNDPGFMSRVFAAGQRHAWAPRKGDPLDDESGFPHSWHELCNAMFKAHRDMLIWRGLSAGDSPAVHAKDASKPHGQSHPMAAEALRDEYTRDDNSTGV